MKNKLPKPPKKLDLRQRRFCEEYIIDWNGTRAAKVAGYSEKTARVQASQLLTNINIKSYIEECKNKIEQLAGVSKLKALKKLSQIAFTDITQAYNDDGSLKPLSDMSDDVKACIEGIETVTIGEDAEVQKLKTTASRGAIQDLAKMLGWNEPDKVDLNIEYDIEL